MPSGDVMTKGRRAVDPITGLTANMEKFCVELARTGNASDAYRKAYNAERMSANAVGVAASELQKNPKITLRLTNLRAEVRKKSGITLEEHMKALGTLRNLSSQAKQYSAAITAEIARGKVSGLYVDGGLDEDAAPVTRVEIVVKDGRKPA
jgi:hypothetical protein